MFRCNESAFRVIVLTLLNILKADYPNSRVFDIVSCLQVGTEWSIDQ